MCFLLFPRQKQEEAAGVKEAEDEDDGETQNPFVPINVCRWRETVFLPGISCCIMIEFHLLGTHTVC